MHTVYPHGNELFFVIHNDKVTMGPGPCVLFGFYLAIICAFEPTPMPFGCRKTRTCSHEHMISCRLLWFSKIIFWCALAVLRENGASVWAMFFFAVWVCESTCFAQEILWWIEWNWSWFFLCCLPFLLWCKNPLALKRENTGGRDDNRGKIMICICVNIYVFIFCTQSLKIRCSHLFWKVFVGLRGSGVIWNRRFNIGYLVDPASGICLSQGLSHASVSISNFYDETANGSVKQL